MTDDEIMLQSLSEILHSDQGREFLSEFSQFWHVSNEPEKDCFITILTIQRYFKTVVVRIKNKDCNFEDLSRCI